jgi:hypothetical protein
MSTVRTFKTIEERDTFIKATYPKRKCLGVPGAYAVPGGTVGVFLYEVTFYPKGSK